MQLVKIAAAIALASIAGTSFAADGDTGATACTITAVTAKSTVQQGEVTGNDDCYVATTFKYNISANVGVVAEQNSTAFAVGTYNIRGRNTYTGSSEGGAVKTCGEPTTGTDAPKAPTLDLEGTDNAGCGKAED